MTKPNVEAPESQETGEILFEKTVRTQEGVNEPIESIETKNETLRFPIKLSADFPSRLRFSAYKIDGLNFNGRIGKQFKKVIEATSKFDFEIENSGVPLGSAFGTTALVSDTINTVSNAGEAVARGTVATGKEALQLAETTGQEFTKSIDNYQKGKRVGQVILPLFRGIRFSDRANYETANLGIIGAGLTGLQSGIDANKEVTNAGLGLAANQIGNILGGALGGIGGAIAGKGFGVGTLVGGFLGDKVFDGLEGVAKSATNLTSSPNKRTLFKDTELRKFSFQFKMVATSETEAIEIKKILTWFRYNMYPEAIALGDDALPFAYKFPNVFEIEVLNKEEDNPAFKIQRCYLESVDTSFNQTATGMFDGKYFVEVDVSLNFTEITALQRKQIREGF